MGSLQEGLRLWETQAERLLPGCARLAQLCPLPIKKGTPMSEQPSGSPPPPSPLCRKARRRLPFPSCSGNRPSGPLPSPLL